MKLVNKYPMKHVIKEPFTNTCGELMQDKKHRRKLSGPLFRPQKISRPSFAMKLWVNPIENQTNLFFTGKFVVIRVSKLLNAPFLHQAPLTCVCEQSVNACQPCLHLNTKRNIFCLNEVWLYSTFRFK